MASPTSAARRPVIIAQLVALNLYFFPAAALAAPINLFPKFAGFALREPQLPPPPGPPRIYSTTNGAPNWLISQWKIAGPKLSPFILQVEGGNHVYEANAPTASVRVVETSAGSTITLGHNGALVPCTTDADKPRESDLFLSSLTQPVGVTPGKKTGYPLTSLNALREIVTVSIDTGPSTPTKGCKVSKGAAVLAIIMTDFDVQPHQIFFYQLSLNDYCRSDIAGSVCKPPALRPINYAAHNPFGSNDRLALVGEPSIQNGETRKLNIDLLPRLKMSIEGGPKNMDRDPSHWAVTGGYFGLITFGDVNVSSTWQNYQMVADTQ